MSLILSLFSAMAAAAEEVRQLQHPRWRVSFQFEMRIRINCMFINIGILLITCFHDDISAALAINFGTQP